MTWDALKIYDLLVDCKTLVVRLSVAIVRKMDIGQPFDGYLDILYLLTNVVFTIEEGSSDLEDADFDYLYSIYTKALARHNRYKGI